MDIVCRFGEMEENIMKKLAAMAGAALLAAGLLTGCGNSGTPAASSGSGSTLDSEQAVSQVQESTSESSSQGSAGAGSDRTTFTVGFDAEFPPYGYRDENGEYVGFDLDLAAEVCARNGWELVKQPIDWDSKDMELSSGAIDCIWNGFTMNNREDEYAFTEPYVDNSQVFVVAGDSGITNKEGLAGKVVAVQKDSSALAALNDEEAPENIALRDSFSQMIEYADYNTAFMDLEQGAVDAVAMDIGVAQYQIKGRNEGDFVMLEEKLATEQYGVGFLLGNEALRDTVQAVLDEMAADGTVDKIAKEWGLEDSVCLGK